MYGGVDCVRLLGIEQVRLKITDNVVQVRLKITDNVEQVKLKITDNVEQVIKTQNN